MKFRTKKVVPDTDAGEVQVQLSVPMYGVLRDVQEAFFGLCVEAGKATLAAMMEADRARICGAKGRPDEKRRAYRGGHASSSVVLGGRRIAVQRPRARGIEGGELALPTFAWAAGSDPLDRATMQSIAAGVTTRRYRGTLDPLPVKEKERSVSKSAVSRRFVELSAEQVQDWLTRKLAGIDLPIVMIDGIYFAERVVLIALGIDARGKKQVLGLREGSTEKTQVVRSMLADLIDRGLDADRPRLWVIDGGKALRRAIIETFGKSALIHRCQEHSVPRRAQTRRVQCLSPDRTSKSGSLGQRVAAQAAALKHVRHCVASTHAGPANEPTGRSESERESSAVMHLRRSFMGEPVNGSAEPVVQGRRSWGTWKRKRCQVLAPRRLSGGMSGMSVQ